MQIPDSILKSCWFLAGPTACGKSAVGIELAQRISAEIIALDSMSLYRGMDVGTAKPSAADRRRIHHHLIDILEPHQEFSVADYLSAAESACTEILQRGNVPLFVGGTGLYLRGILRGVFDGPTANWAFRRRLEEEALHHPPDYLHLRLREVDPTSASLIHANDNRRLIRALEVFHTTGRRLSEQQQQNAPRPVEQRPIHVYWLQPHREWLYERINRRVIQMVAGGLIEEARGLWQSPRPLSRTARQALGYKELFDHFDGRCSLEDAIANIQTRTRQFAKRQHTWFRNLEECTPIDVQGNETPQELAHRILNIAEWVPNR